MIQGEGWRSRFSDEKCSLASFLIYFFSFPLSSYNLPFEEDRWWTSDADALSSILASQFDSNERHIRIFRDEFSPMFDPYAPHVTAKRRDHSRCDFLHIKRLQMSGAFFAFQIIRMNFKLYFIFSRYYGSGVRWTPTDRRNVKWVRYGSNDVDDDEIAINADDCKRMQQRLTALRAIT